MRPFSAESVYPDMIDDRLLFCDPSIPQMPVVKQYENYIAEEDYDSANDVINSINVDYLGAYVANHLESMLCALSTHLLNINGNGRTKTHHQCLKDTQPTAAEIASDTRYKHWISD